MNALINEFLFLGRVEDCNHLLLERRSLPASLRARAFIRAVHRRVEQISVALLHIQQNGCVRRVKEHQDCRSALEGGT